MIEQLKKILIIVENEIFDENSLWDKDQLIKVIKPEMEELYDKFDHNFITNRMLSFYEDPITVEDLLTLFYSFKQYQMNILRRIANQPIPYDIIKSKQKEFDRYVLNPTHDLINTIPVFKEYDIKK